MSDSKNRTPEAKDAKKATEATQAFGECTCVGGATAKEESLLDRVKEALTGTPDEKAPEVAQTPIANEFQTVKDFLNNVVPETVAEKPQEPPQEKALTLEDIEKLEKAAAEGLVGGGLNPGFRISWGHFGIVLSIPRDLGLKFKKFFEEFKVFNPPEPAKIAPPPEIVKVCPDAKDNYGKVFESGLPCGSDNDPNNHCAPEVPHPIISQGNLLANDKTPVPAAITEVEWEGTVYTPNAQGVISITTDDFTLQVYTQAYDGHAAGDYIFTLTGAMEHPDGQCRNKIEENFTYTLANLDGSCSDKADLHIKIVDDVPKANDDCKETVIQCGNTVTGNVMDNDVRGADKAVVTSIKYDNGTQTAYLVDGVVTVTTALGGKLTVHADGSWTYKSAYDKTGEDGFDYTITDRDGDSSCATQPICVISLPPPCAQDDGDCKEFVVFESGLNKGSDHDPDNNCAPDQGKPTTVTGNVLENDHMPVPAHITKIKFDGQSYTPDANGEIKIHTGFSTLNLFTKDYNGHQAGDFIYTLDKAACHPDDQCKNSIEQVFTYTLTDIYDVCQKDCADLTIKIVDDVPKANDDCKQTVDECNPVVCGNVLDNDVAGADCPTLVKSFTYNNGCQVAFLVDGVAEVTTALGGKLTVHENGSWTYVAGSHNKHSGEDGFVYTISDKDGDTSCAEQPICVVAPPVCEPPPCEPPPCEPPPCKPPVVCEPPPCEPPPCKPPVVCVPPPCEPPPCEPPPCKPPVVCEPPPCEPPPCKPPVVCEPPPVCEPEPPVVCEPKPPACEPRCDNDKPHCDVQPDCSKVIAICFDVSNAKEWIKDHCLDWIKATACENNKQVRIPVPENGCEVEFCTPKGGSLAIDKSGAFAYTVLSKDIHQVEKFDCVMQDEGRKDTYKAPLEVNVINHPNSLANLMSIKNNNAANDSDNSHGKRDPFDSLKLNHKYTDSQPIKGKDMGFAESKGLNFSKLGFDKNNGHRDNQDKNNGYDKGNDHDRGNDYNNHGNDNEGKHEKAAAYASDSHGADSMAQTIDHHLQHSLADHHVVK